MSPSTLYRKAPIWFWPGIVAVYCLGAFSLGLLLSKVMA